MYPKNNKNRGNMSEIDPHQDIVSVYETYAVTQATDSVTGTTIPLVNQRHVMEAKKFVDTNHK